MKLLCRILNHKIAIHPSTTRKNEYIYHFCLRTHCDYERFGVKGIDKLLSFEEFTKWMDTNDN